MIDYMQTFYTMNNVNNILQTFKDTTYIYIAYTHTQLINTLNSIFSCFSFFYFSETLKDNIGFVLTYI